MVLEKNMGIYTEQSPKTQLKKIVLYKVTVHTHPYSIVKNLISWTGFWSLVVYGFILLTCGGHIC